MVTPELISYIKTQLAKGATEDSLRQTLITSNWSREDIDQAFLSIKQPQQPPDRLTHVVTPSTEKFPTLLKIGIILFGTILCLFLTLKLLPIVIAPTADAITQCFRIATEQGEKTTNDLKLISDETERTNKFCDEDTTQLNELITCVRNAKSSNIFFTHLVDLFLPTRTKITTSIEEHNKYCPEFY